MILLIMLTIVITLLEVLRVSLYFLRKDVSILKKIFELLVLIIMIVLEYFILVKELRSAVYISLMLSLYVLICFVYERVYKNEYISILSIKKGIDASNTGIMFLKNDNIVLINSLFYEVLSALNINDNYIRKLIDKSFKKINNDYLLRYNNKVYMLKIYDDREVSLIDVTELYNLQEKDREQNIKIKENNDKLLIALKNVKILEKEKSLLRLKNECHDIIGYRLALFSKYLEQEGDNVNDVLFLLDSIYEDFNSKLSGEDKLKNLIKMYYIIGIKIELDGLLPKNENLTSVLFEVIREAVTNAVIHADSKNIKVVISQEQDSLEMVITNDGEKAKPVIYENEGIKGMRKKLAKIGGSLKILNDDVFTLIVKI